MYTPEQAKKINKVISDIKQAASRHDLNGQILLVRQELDLLEQTDTRRNGARTLLASLLLKRSRKNTKNKPGKDNPDLLEAKTLLLGLSEKNLHVLMAKQQIAEIEGDFEEEKRLLRLEIEPNIEDKKDPNHERARSILASLLLNDCERRKKNGQTIGKDDIAYKEAKGHLDRLNDSSYDALINKKRAARVVEDTEELIFLLGKEVRLTQGDKVNNMKAKIALAQVLAKSMLDDMENENIVLQSDPRLVYADECLRDIPEDNVQVVIARARIARVKGDTEEEIKWIKRQSELETDEKDKKSAKRVAASLLLKSCRQDKKAGIIVKSDDERIIDAKGLLSGLPEDEINTILCKVQIARFDGDTKEEERLLRKVIDEKIPYPKDPNYETVQKAIKRLEDSRNDNGNR